MSTPTAPNNAPTWSDLAVERVGLRPVILDEDGLLEAQQLLYDVYVEEMEWEPAWPNPSGLVAIHQVGRLVDDFDKQATWVGLRDHDEALVAVARVLRRSELGRLELERYAPLAPRWTDVDGEIIEPNRLAIVERHRTTQALLILHLAVEDVARQLDAVRCLATMAPARARTVSHLFGWQRTGHSFRYHPDDPEEAELICLDGTHQDPVALLRRLQVRDARRRRLRPHRGRPSQPNRAESPRGPLP